MQRLAAWGAAVVALSTAGAVVAQDAPADLERGQQLLRQADFTAAREAFEAALTGELTTHGQAVAHVHLATIAIVFEETAEAEAHALRAIAHDRAVELPPGAPRALERMLREARERLAALALDLEVGAIDGERARLALVLASPQPDLVAELALWCETESGVALAERGPPPRLVADVGRKPMRCIGRGHDEAGAVLVDLERSLFERRLAGALPAARGAATPTDDESSSGLALPLGIAGGVVVVVVAAILVATLAGGDGSNVASFDDTRVRGW